MDDFWRQPIAGYPKTYDPWRNPGGAVFHQDVAERVCDFIESELRLSSGNHKGKKWKLQPWQRQYFGHLFGWKQPDGRRRYRSTLLYLPRKNGKTQMAAALLAILSKFDGEISADVYCCAYDKGQADLVFLATKDMFIFNPDIAEGSVYTASKRRIDHYSPSGVTNGGIQVKASDGDSNLGTNPHAFIIDELLTQKKFDVMDALESGVGTRDQPLGIYLSTAPLGGYSPCNIRVDYARKVRDGEVDDPSYLPVIFELPDGEDWRDEANWAKVNPNLGVTVKIEFLRQEFAKATTSKDEEIKFKRFYLNMSISAIDSWLPMEDWDACPDDIKPEDLDGADCYAGLDLSQTSDITAYLLYFPAFEACLCRFYCPKQAVLSKIEYGLMFKDFLRVTPGTSVDYEAVRADLNSDKERYNILKVGFDPFNARHLSTELEKDGFQMVEVAQSAKVLTDPTRQLESQVRARKLRHFKNPVLRWMAGNCMLWTDTNGKAVKVLKRHKDSPAKIDGIISLIMCKGLEIEDLTEKREESAFDDPNFNINNIWDGGK
jgi:phage terminase large subunit-like protein